MMKALSEKQIEDRVFASGEIFQIAHRENLVRWTNRQVTLPSGRLDLIGVTDQGNIVIAEVKKGNADGRAVAQVGRYALDMMEAIHLRQSNYFTPKIIKCVIAEGFRGKTLEECYAANVEAIAYSHDPFSIRKIGKPGTYKSRNHQDYENLYSRISEIVENAVDTGVAFNNAYSSEASMVEGESPDEFGINFDRDGCEWFESPIWQIMEDEEESSIWRKAVVDHVADIFSS